MFHKYKENQLKSMLDNESGYLLVLSTILVMVLGISGAGFLHLDGLERRVVLNEVDNHSAFFLASTGLERARATFKIPIIDDEASWTSILDSNHPDHPAEYPTDPNPDPLLCPDPTRGCVIPPFQTALVNGVVITIDGDPVTALDPIPFAGTFDDGSYSVRAFNNEAGLVDTDMTLTIRALGTVRGEQKLLEVTVLAVSGLSLVNCEGTPGADCPDDCSGPPTNPCADNPTLTPTEGRRPTTYGELPTLVDALTEPTAYYRTPSNFPGTVDRSGILPPGGALFETPTPDNSTWLPGQPWEVVDASVPAIVNVGLVPAPDNSAWVPGAVFQVFLEDNSYFYQGTAVNLSSGNITVDGDNAIAITNLVVLSLGETTVKSGIYLDTIVIGATGVDLTGGPEVRAPPAAPGYYFRRRFSCLLCHRGLGKYLFCWTGRLKPCDITRTINR